MPNIELDRRRRRWLRKRPTTVPALLARDGTACRYCSVPLADALIPDTTIPVPDHQGGGYIAKPGHRFLQVDHVIPLVRGGTDNLVNLVLCCGDCNASKGAR